MGFNSVYQCLLDVFPMIDYRLLRAVAIENSKDVDAAVETVLSEVVPYLSKIFVAPSSARQAALKGTASTFMQKDKSPVVNVTSASNDKNQTETLTYTQKNKLSISGSCSTQEEDSPIELSDADNEECRFLRRRRVSRRVPLTSRAIEAAFEERFSVPRIKQAEMNKEAGQAKADVDPRSSGLTCGSPLVNAFDENTQISANTESEEVILLGTTKEQNNAVKSSQIDNTGLDILVHGNGEYADDIVNVDQEQDSHVMQKNSSVHENDDDFSSCGKNDACDFLKDFDGPGAIGIDLNVSVGTENNLSIPAEEHNEFIDSWLGGENERTMTRSGQICNVDLLEEIIKDAKTNKFLIIKVNVQKTLFLAMESILDLMRNIELEEKSAEQAKEEAADAGLDIIKKVEELKEMLSHAKEANDMHSGEVYGEKSILATEVRELQTRVLSLAVERDKSLAILDEMRQTLEARRAEAEELRKAAEKEKMEKTESAQSFLAEQEAAMENVVQESKILQQEADENSKLRDFLIENGRVVDILQGEISVICQDVRLLKENFDKRVPFSKSISSSQTSCKLASSGSLKSIASDLEKSLSPKDDILATSNFSLKSMASDLEKSLSPKEVSPSSVLGSSSTTLSPKSIVSDLEKSLTPKEWSPASSVYEQSQKSSYSPKSKLDDERSRADDHKELLEDGWDLFEVENGMYSPFV
ncbi:hypothetical protein ACFE04_031650 [Oxalis oulophora]